MPYIHELRVCLSVFRMLDEKKNLTGSYITLLLTNVQYIQKWPPSFSMHNLARLWKRISIVYCFVDVKAMAGYNTGHLWSLISLDYYLQWHANYKKWSIFPSGMYQVERKAPYLGTKEQISIILERNVLLLLSTTQHNWRYDSFNSKHRYEKQWVTSFTPEPI